MLVNDPAIAAPDLILDMISSVNGRAKRAERQRDGVYIIGHFGSSHWPAGFCGSPVLGERHTHGDYTYGSFGPHGVCDDVEQILAACPEVEADPQRQFVITLTPILAAEQESPGGWRWHKWGEYIGTHKPEHEYIADEKGIERVYVFHIYEKKK